MQSISEGDHSSWDVSSKYVVNRMCKCRL